MLMMRILIENNKQRTTGITNQFLHRAIDAKEERMDENRYISRQQQQQQTFFDCLFTEENIIILD